MSEEKNDNRINLGNGLKIHPAELEYMYIKGKGSSAVKEGHLKTPETGTEDLSRLSDADFARAIAGKSKNPDKKLVEEVAKDFANIVNRGNGK